jgi:histone demethylase JARID1
VEEADGLGLGRALAIRKIELLRSLLRASQHGAEELAAALSDDRVSSAEELAALLERAQKLPILPSRADEIAARLHQCRAWEARATQLLRNGIARSTPKPPLAEVEAFCYTADTHFVPSSSLLRRQLHSRVQDAKRWQQSVVSLFLRPSGSRMALDTFFSRALSRLRRDSSSDVNGGIFQRWRAHCVCEQVLNDKAPVIPCRRCSRFFHPACVGLAPSSRQQQQQQQQQQFTCSDCLHGATKASPSPFMAPPDVFCSCRGPEILPMVCCDFCDEWYHGACVGMSEADMARVEAYRCPRCAIRERVAYLDKTLTSPTTTPSLCEGRRPALARVHALLTQLSTQLVAEPAGARALVAYVEAVEAVVGEARAFAKQFTREFSPASFAQMDATAEQRRVAAMLERLAALEIAPGTGKSDDDAEEDRGSSSSGSEPEDDDVVASLRAIHWCLRACSLVLGCDHAPKYSHLVVLLEDARRIQQRQRTRQQQASASSASSAAPPPELPPALLPPFAPSEYSRIQQTIRDLVARAERWLRQVKMLEVEEWNIGKARRLRGEYAELVQFLELPAAEVKLVHDIASGNGSSFAADGSTAL